MGEGSPLQLRQGVLAGIYTVVYKPVADHRGFLSKPFHAATFKEHGLDVVWQQAIHSYSERQNTLRGLYVQREPYAEGKLVIALRGSMFWVAVDVRKDSKTFGQWEGTILSPDQTQGLFIVRGFAHGCLSLSDQVDLFLLADNDHSETHSVGIAWDDPELKIDWPLLGTDLVISEAHANHPSFAEFRQRYGGL